ncbi:MAG: hypothetical protein PHR39_07950 [Actinomycetota bacterium]|nr:hypothetical protein [Actinomycetota bacterium]
MNSIQIEILAILHILICLSYFAINVRFKGLQNSFYKLAIILFLPVAGILFFIVSAIFEAFGNKSDSMVESYLKYVKDDKHIYYEEAIDFEKEINTIPIADSLEFSSNKNKRAYLIYILKRDFSKHIKGLQKAIKSSDTETSHYAASALMEIKKQFEIAISSAREKYESNKENIAFMKEYLEILKKYLKSGLADKIDYGNYLQKYSSVLAEFLKQDKASESYFIDKINCEIELLDSKSALEYCDIFFNSFPDSEKPYLMLLKIYYTSNKPELFGEVLKTLKKRKLSLTDYGEAVIKFWEG